MRLIDGSPDLWVHPVEMNYLSVFSDLMKYGRVRKQTAYNATTQKPLLLDGTLSIERLLQFYEFHIQMIEQEYRAILLGGTLSVPNPLGTMRRSTRYSPRQFLPPFLECTQKAYDDRGRSPKLYAFKTIETPYIEEYERIFPEMRFIHIIRNPLANYSSLKRTNMVKKSWPFWQHGGDEMRMFLEKRWLPHARFLVNEGLSKDSKHFLIRYEDLVANPTEIISNLFSWLGIVPPSDPTHLTVLGGKEIADTTSNPSGIGVSMPSRVVADMAAKFDYKDVLPFREKEFILYRTYRLATELDCPFEEEQARFPNRLNLATKWLLPDHWELVNVYSNSGVLHRVYRTILHLKALVERRLYIYRKLLFPFA
jgi:hypothetical protein